MNVTDFFQQSAGKWFSQRTHYSSDAATPESSRSDIYIDYLETDASDVVQLCEQHQEDPASVLGAVQIRWEGIVPRLPDKQIGSAILVAIANPDSPTHGKLLQSSNRKAVIGSYSLGADEALTLVTELEDGSAEERIWFAAPNLRLRTRVLKTTEGVRTAAFYSEIRMGAAQ